METDDPQVITAAELVLRNLTQGKGPIERYSFLLTSESEDSRKLKVQVVEASKQVSELVCSKFAIIREKGLEFLSSDTNYVSLFILIRL